jgi:hypothetical protein
MNMQTSILASTNSITNELATMIGPFTIDSSCFLFFLFFVFCFFSLNEESIRARRTTSLIVDFCNFLSHLFENSEEAEKQKLYN